MVEMLKEADSRGSKFVVFPELALTTFFPRYWMEDQAEVDKYFESQMPSPETLPLFELARSKGIGFYLGYAELTEEEGKTHRFNTSILVGPDGRIDRQVPQGPSAGPDDHRPNVPYQHLEKKYFEVGDLGFNVWKMFKDDVIVGQCICNDRRWPETFRVMGLKGAEMVVLGYNTPSDNVYAPHEPPYLRVFHHNLSLQANAYQNGIWVVATAKAGKEDGFWPAWRLGDRRADRRDRRQDHDRGGRGHLLRLRPGARRIYPQHHLQFRQAPPHRALQADHRTHRREGRAGQLRNEDMQYAVSDVNHHDRYKILTAFVLPRPIAWVTTLGPTGVVNAAPFSFFNVFAEDPPLCMFAINKRPDGRIKDTWTNIERTGAVRGQPDRRAAGAGDARVRAATFRPTSASRTISGSSSRPRSTSSRRGWPMRHGPWSARPGR